VQATLAHYFSLSLPLSLALSSLCGCRWHGAIFLLFGHENTQKHSHMQYLSSKPEAMDTNLPRRHVCVRAGAQSNGVFGTAAERLNAGIRLLSYYHQHFACAWQQTFSHSPFFSSPSSENLSTLALHSSHSFPRSFSHCSCIRSPPACLPPPIPLSYTHTHAHTQTVNTHTLTHLWLFECCLELDATVQRPVCSFL